MQDPRFSRVEIFLLTISLLVVLAYFAGIPNKPPGFFIDEASIAFNAHTIAQHGVDEHGQRFPLYFRAFGEYKSPVYIYALAAISRITGPSNFVARVFSAVLGLTAVLLLGLLAFQITRRRTAGLIVFIAAGLTPWLFEISRLVFEVTLLPPLLALFLLVLHRASERQQWSWSIAATLAALLGLMVYSYSAGRLLAPLFAFGLIFFFSRTRWRSVVLTWILFGVMLLPLVAFSVRHPGTLGERFKYVTYVKPEDTRPQIVLRFIKNYARDFSPRGWLVTGDPEPRHHLPGRGSLLAGDVVLAIMGIVLVLHYRRREAWWRFVLYGLMVSPIPAALTLDHFHTLRLIAVPVFLMVLVIPSVEFCCAEGARKTVRQILLAALVLATIIQGAFFQYRFHTAPPRVDAWDSYYPQVLDAALAQPGRPIYLLDKTPAAYMYAYWYSTLRGLDLNNYHRVGKVDPVPPGAVVISHETPCTNCEMILERGQFRVYRQQ